VSTGLIRAEAAGMRFHDEEPISVRVNGQHDRRERPRGAALDPSAQGSPAELLAAAGLSSRRRRPAGTRPSRQVYVGYLFASASSSS
jgi:hypothetical protein